MDYIRKYVGKSPHKSLIHQTRPPFSEPFASEVFNRGRLSRTMKTPAPRETNEPTAEGDLWLDEYPVEVLEAVFTILKTQRDQPASEKPS